MRTKNQVHNGRDVFIFKVNLYKKRGNSLQHQKASVDLFNLNLLAEFLSNIKTLWKAETLFNWKINKAPKTAQKCALGVTSGFLKKKKKGSLQLLISEERSQTQKQTQKGTHLVLSDMR